MSLLDPVIPPVADDLSIPEGTTCQEAAPVSVGFYVPCGRPAVAVVDNGDRRPYYMCDACTSHNVTNRRARVLAPESEVAKWPQRR